MASPLKSITQHLPAFIREPAIAIIGQECYTTLIYNLDLDDRACLQLAISKVLGLGIVVGGGIVKVPQIIKIIKSHSARGLSLSSYLLDTASLLLNVAYNVRLEFPFSTYGENVALTVQNIVIIGLIIYYSQTRTSLTTNPSPPWLAMIGFLAVTALASYALISDQWTPLSVLRTGLWISIPMSSFAKVPQIVTNLKNHSTGQLSAFLVFNSLLGCLARLFTTSTETGDATLWWSFFSAAALNGILALQMLYYWRVSEPTPLKVTIPEEKSGATVAPSPKLNTVPRLGSQVPQRTTSPVGKPVSTARWQRKAD